MNNKSSKLLPQDLNDDVYSPKYKNIFFLPAISPIFLLWGFVLNFPVTENIEKTIAKFTKISKKVGCNFFN